MLPTKWCREKTHGVTCEEKRAATWTKRDRIQFIFVGVSSAKVAMARSTYIYRETDENLLATVCHDSFASRSACNENNQSYRLFGEQEI